MKTDLNLLLECLKFQMDNPQSQKEALVTIYSICQENSDACDYFREIGGLLFVSNLAKSSTHYVVKEASLFTLGILAENNVYCQQTLCNLELFEDVCTTLSDEDSSVNLKRMSVYIFLVLVSNNKTGQTLARESGCIDILLFLFRETLMTGQTDLTDENTCHSYQLWSSVCSALCACANNPQNDENQKLCSSAFTQAKYWLQHYMKPDIVRPICSLVGLTVANNSFAQDYFTSVGGVDALADILQKLVNDLQKSFSSSSSKLAVVVTKTLDACIADNTSCTGSLSKYNTVSNLLKLLSFESLNPEDIFSIVLTLGHCTENCEKNQYELLKNNGLPIVIQVLTESQDEELNKAATFVLQNCKNITENVFHQLSDNTSSIKTGLFLDQNTNEKPLDEYWKKAKYILQKIEYLEQQQNKKMIKEDYPKFDCGNSIIHTPIHVNEINAFLEEDTSGGALKPSGSGLQNTIYCPKTVTVADTNRLKKQIPCNEPCLTKLLHGRFAGPSTAYLNKDKATTPQLQKNCRSVTLNSIDENASAYSKNAPMEKVRRRIFSEDASLRKCAASGHAGEIERDSQPNPQESFLYLPCRNLGNKSNISINNPPMRDAAIQTQSYRTNKKHCDGYPNKSSEVLKEAKQVEMSRSSLNSRHDLSIHQCINQETYSPAHTDPLTLCSDIISDEICSNLKKTKRNIDLRCSGCLRDKDMNSRNCSTILKNCLYQCERHRVILEAEEQYKRKIKKLLYSSGSSTYVNYKQLTPLTKGGMDYESFLQRKAQPNSFLLTPIKKVTFSTNLTTNESHNNWNPDKSPGFVTHLSPDPTKVLHRKKVEIEGNSPASPIIQNLVLQSSTKNIQQMKMSERRSRKDFTEQEIAYILDGVKKFGHHWNSILWSYPFQKGRQNVDLAKKYKHLQVQMC
ncbi:telomere repeats-binding bouquet formation protein 1 [Bombina bombina]|uniref:telomere repeats-binding bouquet formation protein 1 n=1 Tax=Bombina bombina TaxID=8345 RepID=UPI00235A752C|nr:telomere repeats-binding bouquet formation protein 1 [Bombina bombina]